MVLRLLAFNAEAWLAERLNAYLRDNDEYRATLRNLLHLGGQITYTTQAITGLFAVSSGLLSVRPCRRAWGW